MILQKLFLALAFISTTFLIAQNDASNDKEGTNPTLTVEDLEIDSYRGISSVYKTAYGSPYLDEDLNLGTLLKGNNAVQAYLRYNIFYNEIEIAENRNSDDLSSLIKNNDINAVINGKTFTYAIRNIDGQAKGGFYEIIAKGSKYDLYKQYNIRYISPRAATTSLQSDRPGKFVQSFEYYLVSGDGEFTLLPQKRRLLLKTTEGDKDLIKDFLKENKIDLSEDEDMAKFVDYYNTL